MTHHFWLDVCVCARGIKICARNLEMKPGDSPNLQHFLAGICWNDEAVDPDVFPSCSNKHMFFTRDHHKIVGKHLLYPPSRCGVKNLGCPVDRPHIWQNPRGAGQPCPLPLELDAKPRSFRFNSDHIRSIWRVMFQMDPYGTAWLKQKYNNMIHDD